jgi:hypothetical protein
MILPENDDPNGTLAIIKALCLFLLCIPLLGFYFAILCGLGGR